MRNHIALAIGATAAVIALVLGYQGIQTWAWGAEMTAIVWVFTAMWLGGRSLNQTHRQLVAQETNVFTRMSGLARHMFNGAMTLTAIAIVLYFAGK